MVNRWDTETLLNHIQPNIGKDRKELRDIVSETDISDDVKVILVAESFDPEVILTSDWLTSKHSVDITAFAISLHKIEEQTVILFEQRYPLKELSDVYVSRKRSQGRKIGNEAATWEQVLPKLKYPFAEEAIRLCQKYLPGDPGRRRSGHIRSNFKGFHWINLNFRENYINVYTDVNQEEGQAVIKKIFGENMQIIPWRDGISFYIQNEDEFKKLVEWLEL